MILHNNNLPNQIVDLAFGEPVGEIEFMQEPVAQASSDNDDLDTFLSKRISAIFPGDAPDLVVLPYSLSQVNPLEFSGIRLAAHMRVSENIEVSTVPFLFLGPGSLEEGMRVSDMGAFLLTPGVFTSTLNTSEQLLDWIEKHRDSLHPISDGEMQSFFERFTVKAPSNYEDGHHAITNIWSMIRWHEMFKWDDGNCPELGQDAREFSNSLFAKWLIKSLGTREHFKPKKKKSPAIPLIEGKKIVHIDDEYASGWGSLFERIFTKSKTSYVPFTDFSKAYSQAVLIENIKSFIDENSDADCFLVDIRLHEQDHQSDDYKSYTGHVISRYIYEKNHGNQIVVFTASDKTWNYKLEAPYFSGYVIKENPLKSFSREQSETLFNDFAHAIQNACAHSYLKDYYIDCKSSSYLNDFFEILRRDDDSRNTLHDINLRSAALNLMVYIESTIKDKFSLDGFTLKKGSEAVGSANSIYIESKKDEHGNYVPTRMEVYDSLTPGPDWKQVTTSDIFLICSALRLYYDIMVTEKINEVIDLKNIRNRSIAHASGGQSKAILTTDFLKKVFDDIVAVMVRHP